MRPTKCATCFAKFEDRPMLQAEARHVAVIAGEVAAAQFVDEALEDFHADHTQEGNEP